MPINQCVPSRQWRCLLRAERRQGQGQGLIDFRVRIQQSQTHTLTHTDTHAHPLRDKRYIPCRLRWAFIFGASFAAANSVK